MCKAHFFILQQYLEYWEEKVTIAPILGTYGLIMNRIASFIGSQKNYEDAMEINKKIIEQSLLLRHLEYVEDNIYDLMLHEEKRKGLSKEKNPDRIICM